VAATSRSLCISSIVGTVFDLEEGITKLAVDIAVGLVVDVVAAFKGRLNVPTHAGILLEERKITCFSDGELSQRGASAKLLIDVESAVK